VLHRRLVLGTQEVHQRCHRPAAITFFACLNPCRVITLSSAAPAAGLRGPRLDAPAPAPPRPPSGAPWRSSPRSARPTRPPKTPHSNCPDVPGPGPRSGCGPSTAPSGSPALLPLLRAPGPLPRAAPPGPACWMGLRVSQEPLEDGRLHRQLARPACTSRRKGEGGDARHQKFAKGLSRANDTPDDIAILSKLWHRMLTPAKA